MVSLQTVRANNSALKDLGPGLVAVFVGGTSGIGETSAREFVRNTTQPRVYLVGRSPEQASRIIQEFVKLNPEGKVSFVKSDLSLLRNVDVACKEIQAKEDKVNLLFMTPGYVTGKGRDETPEGLDRKFSLHYYARMRFIHNLLPQLTAAQSTPLSRVVSVLSSGAETKLNFDDLSLKTHFSLANCAAHACTMNSLAAEELAAQHPGTTFVHAFPGIVKSGAARGAGPVLFPLLNMLTVLLRPWMVPVGESGERHLYAATSATFPPRADGPDRARLEEGQSAAVGSTGESGSGAYLLSWDGEPCGKEKMMQEHREQGNMKRVWDHTMEVFEKICGTEGGKY